MLPTLMNLRLTVDTPSKSQRSQDSGLDTAEVDGASNPGAGEVLVMCSKESQRFSGGEA